MKRTFFGILVLFFAAGCTTDYANLPAFSENQFMQAVVETPAGSGALLAYDFQNGRFPEIENPDAGEKLSFMPPPLNLGFVPSTANATPENRNPLPVGIISGSREPGTVLEIMPLGVLLLETEDELHYQLIAIPAKPSEQTLHAETFAEFSAKYPAAKKIAELWFQYQNPGVKTRLMGWKDEKFAEELVQKKLK